MIDLKSNPDFLHTLAADTREAGRDETAKDLDNAAHDIKNLRDYAERLEWNVGQMSSEINSIRTQRDDAAAALLAIFRPELEKMVQLLVNEQIEDMQADIEDMKEKCEDIPNEDQITDSIREFMQYEAKFRVTLE
jgi:predicted  nucleic acid-binding Zn-ribbon protein